MGEIFFYILFGFLDVIANLALIYKLYRFPFWEYKKEFIIIAVILSVSSYCTRILLSMPEIDMPLQYLLYILFFRYLLKIRFYYSVPLAAIGYLFFTVVQFIVYPLLMATQVVSVSDGLEVHGWGIYTIQLSSELSCYLIAYIMYKLGIGFSHITRPPQEVHIPLHDVNFKLNIFVNIFGSIVIVSIMYWVYNYHSYIYIVLPSSLIALVSLIYLSYRKDFLDDHRENFVKLG